MKPSKRASRYFALFVSALFMVWLAGPMPAVASTMPPPPTPTTHPVQLGKTKPVIPATYLALYKAQKAAKKQGLAASSSCITCPPPCPPGIPAASDSHYVTLADGQAYQTVLYNEGYNEPSPTTCNGGLTVFLEFGGVCSTGSIWVYQTTCTGDGGVSDYTVAFWAQYFLDGYANNPAHHQSGALYLDVGVNNSVDWGSSTASIYYAEGEDLNANIAANTIPYADKLNNWANASGYKESFFVEGGNDTETIWNTTDAGFPAATIQWYKGWACASNGLTGCPFTFLSVQNNGAQFSSCSTKSCWDKVTDHQWTSDQIWQTVATNFAEGFPEMYDTNWGTYYRDLYLAATSAGKPTYQYYGVMWGCGTGGNEPNASQAYTDFFNQNPQQSGGSYAQLTTMHALDKSC